MIRRRRIRPRRQGDILRLDAELVYPGQDTPGTMDEARLQKLEGFYLAQGIVEKPVPVTDLYTNQFVR